MSREQSETGCASVRPGRRTSAVAFSGDVGEDDPLLGFAPFLHPVPRRNSITPEKQRAFVATLAATGIVTQAARSIGVSLESLYKLRHRAGAEGFSAAWDAALDRGFARLEDCALERAIAGEERPVVWDGQVVTSWKRYDTALLTFLLKTRRSAKYGADRAGVVTVAELKPGHPVYERLIKEWHTARGEQTPEEARASIRAKLLALRDKVLAQRAAQAAAAAAGAEAGDDPSGRVAPGYIPALTAYRDQEPTESQK